jgi:hypothetical protein
LSSWDWAHWEAVRHTLASQVMWPVPYRGNERALGGMKMLGRGERALGVDEGLREGAEGAECPLYLECGKMSL